MGLFTNKLLSNKDTED